MTKRAITLAFLSSFLLVGAASAQTPAPAEPTAPVMAPAEFPADARIAFVDLQAVVQNSALGRAGQTKLKMLSDQKASEIAEKNKAIRTLEAEIQGGQNVLAAAVLQQKSVELDRAQRELQFLQQQAQIDYDTMQSQLLDGFGREVIPIIEEIRAARKLWAVLSAGDGTGLLAVAPALDLSAEVVRRLDAVQ